MNLKPCARMREMSPEALLRSSRNVQDVWVVPQEALQLREQCRFVVEIITRDNHGIQQLPECLAFLCISVFKGGLLFAETPVRRRNDPQCQSQHDHTQQFQTERNPQQKRPTRVRIFSHEPGPLASRGRMRPREQARWSTLNGQKFPGSSFDKTGLSPGPLTLTCQTNTPATTDRSTALHQP